MSQYEILTEHLLEAEEQFRTVAAGLGEQCERLEAVAAEWPENLTELHQQLACIAEAVNVASGYANEIARTLQEIAEIYAQAERSAFKDEHKHNNRTTAVAEALASTIRMPSALLTTGDLIMPDWLVLAVLKYMQSQFEMTEGAGSDEL